MAEVLTDSRQMLLRALAAKDAEIERLRRENGSLARMYALAEETLRERTGELNQVQAALGRSNGA